MKTSVWPVIAVDSLRTLPVQRKKGSCAHADKKSMGSFIQMKEGTFLGVPSTFRQCLFHMISPHSEDAAFITCVYLSDAEYDYKSAPIKALEQYLRKTYARVFAVTDEKGVFPNGDLAFFTRNGYRDNGVIFEDQAYCKLHLVSKDLNE